MEQQRRWTVMVVPHGSDSPRSISVSVRALKAVGTAAGILGLVAMIGLGGWGVMARISGAVIAPGTIEVEGNRQLAAGEDASAAMADVAAETGSIGPGLRVGGASGGVAPAAAPAITRASNASRRMSLPPRAAPTGICRRPGLVERRSQDLI